jgi:hypothetical protein
MGKKDPRVDAYIAKSPAFAKPILTHIRARVHDAVPDVVETMKWSVPHFEYKGPMCGMAAFKAHCRFGFMKLGEANSPSVEKIESLEDLPADRVLDRLLKRAAALNEQGVKMARTARPKPPLKVPSYFMAAVRKNKKAAAAFNAFPPSHKREYVEWIAEAKSDETRQKRLETALQWMAEGKPRNWKYMRPKSS